MNNKINTLSIMSMIYSLSSATFYGISCSYLYNISNTSILISMLIGYILSILLSIIYLKLFSYKENLSFNNKIKHIYKKFHYIPNTLIIISSILLYIIFTNRLVSFLSTQYLIETSKITILLLIILTTYYTASKGIETISRVSIISFFISIFIYLFDILSLIKHIKIDNILPIIPSTNTIIYPSIVFCIIFTCPLFYINSIYKNQLVDKDKFNKRYFITQFISFIFLYLAAFTTLGVYGINLCNIFDYPLYTVLKKISLFNFIDSVENMSIIQWIISSVNTSTIILYFIIQNIKETINKNTKIIDYIILFISILIPLFYLNNSSIIESFKYIKLPIIIVLIPSIICILSLIIKRN